MEHKTSDGWTARLGDDGTLDTVIVVTSPKGIKTEERFDGDYVAANFRSPDTGALTGDGFKELAKQAIDAAADLFADVEICSDCGKAVDDHDPRTWSDDCSKRRMEEVPPALSHPRGGMEYPRPTCEGCGKDFRIAERRAAAPLALPVVVSYVGGASDPIGAYLWPDGWLSGGACESPWCLQCADSLGARVEVGEWEEGDGGAYLRKCGYCGDSVPCEYHGEGPTREPGDGAADNSGFAGGL